MPSLETLPSPPLSQFWASTVERCILSAPHCKQRLPLSHFPPHCTQFLLPRCHQPLPSPPPLWGWRNRTLLSLSTCPNVGSAAQPSPALCRADRSVFAQGVQRVDSLGVVLFFRSGSAHAACQAAPSLLWAGKPPSEPL